MITDRDVTKAISDAFKSGSLKIESVDGDDEESECVCDTCGKKIDDCLDAYSYHIINDEDMVSINEKLFCCKPCWQKYLIKEAKKLKNGN